VRFCPRCAAGAEVRATEVRGFARENLPWDELASWSTQRALRNALGA
jgi:hypothetical protein